VAVEKYGLKFSHPLSDLEVELYAFRHNRTPELGGLGRYEHFKRAANIVWPDLIWNEWLERQCESLCENQWVSWTGCAASGKTFGSALYALTWWLADPQNSTVILTSTTAKMIRKRAWSNICHLHRTCDGTLPGNLVDSKTTLQAAKGDDKNAIFAVAVLDGATSKAVANIQGIHSDRILAIVDEATDTPEAAFEAASNLSKGCSEFQFLAIGNPQSKLDEHGRFSEPKAGWETVGVETEEWETMRGVCLRFDGMKSPNMKAGRAKYEFLITPQQVEQSIKFEGESSPKFWKYVRGMWSPEGVCRTVLSETLCDKHTVGGEHTFINNATVVAGLDPAFGGDRCILRFARYGDLEGGLMGVEFDEVVNISLDASSPEPIHYQIASKVRDACRGKGCLPENLAIDATGEGGGLCDIMAKEWSNEIRRIEFGGRASELPVSQEDPRPAHEVYANRVTELWFSVREWVIRNQIRGLDRETIIEFCTRMFDDAKRKIVIERKVDMKGRTAQSPDLADAAALIVEVARQMGAGRLKRGQRADTKWENVVKEHDELYHEDALYAEVDY
tara:strand:- start:8928 stop:10610 length:1683 start_codon:yes stop_codon:yes gene_type:complete